MPFTSGRYYMHKNAKDVCLQVLKIRYIGHTSVTLAVIIFNLGYTGNPWALKMDKKYTISKDQYSNYVELRLDQIYIARTKEGIPHANS